jgi:hypothetical protein
LLGELGELQRCVAVFVLQKGKGWVKAGREEEKKTYF